MSKSISPDNRSFFEQVENRMAGLSLLELKELHQLVQNRYEQERAEAREAELSDESSESSAGTLTKTFGHVSEQKMHAIRQKIQETL